MVGARGYFYYHLYIDCKKQWLRPPYRFISVFIIIASESDLSKVVFHVSSDCYEEIDSTLFRRERKKEDFDVSLYMKSIEG